MRNTGLSVCDKLLLAAARIEDGGNSPFSAENLVISAWKCFPETFGLRGHSDDNGVPLYPDSNRVFAEIMGSKPIRKRGLLVKVGQKMYQLTESGRARAQTLENASGKGSAPHGEAKRLGLGREIQAELRRLLATRAVQKVDSGQEESLNFYEACIFWGITPQSKAIELQGRFSGIESSIQIADETLKGGRARFQHGGRIFSADSVDLLRRTHEILLSTFAEQVQVILKRIDQRKR